MSPPTRLHNLDKLSKINIVQVKSDKKGNFHFTCQFLPPNERHRGGVGRTAIVGGHFQVKCSRPLDDSVHLRHEILLKNFQKNQFPFNSFMEQRSSKSEIQNIWNRIFLKIFGCHFCFFLRKIWINFKIKWHKNSKKSQNSLIHQKQLSE